MNGAPKQLQGESIVVQRPLADLAQACLQCGKARLGRAPGRSFTVSPLVRTVSPLVRKVNPLVRKVGPVVGLGNGCILGLQLVLRLHHPQVVLPAALIPHSQQGPFRTQRFHDQQAECRVAVT